VEWRRLPANWRWKTNRLPSGVAEEHAVTTLLIDRTLPTPRAAHAPVVPCWAEDAELYERAWPAASRLDEALLRWVAQTRAWHGLDDQSGPVEYAVPAPPTARTADATWVVETLAWHEIAG
jgi:hypothetical protein